MTELTEGERRVLEELVRESKRMPAKELASKLAENKERVVSILNSLAQRELIELSVHEIVTYRLTEEGKTYSDLGLPEIRLFKSVKELEEGTPLDIAVNKAGLDGREKGIAISWARKNGWLRITKEDGTTVLMTNVTDASSDLTELLRLLDEHKIVPETLSDAVKQGLDRTLIESETTKEFEAELREDRLDRIEKLLSSETQGIGNLTPSLLMSDEWKGKTFRPYNVEITPPYVNYGKKHPYAEFNDWLKEILVGLGFTEWFGPYVESEFWNNDVLFVPQDHVAREVQDQFRVVEPYSSGSIMDMKHYRAVKAVHEDGGDTGSKGWEAPFSKDIASRLVLRAHTTPVSMRYLSEHRESPQKMFIIDRNFRSETLDASHAMEFNQCEGIIMDKGLTLRDLMGYITEICKRVGIKKMKFKPGQFPFTEPSVEGFAKHETLGWIEVAPGGIFRPEVTYPLGIKDSVLAWGIGSGRLYMASMGIDDIRELYSRDLKWLRRSYFLR